MEANGVEPMTPCVQGRCSSQLSYAPIIFKVLAVSYAREAKQIKKIIYLLSRQMTIVYKTNKYKKGKKGNADHSPRVNISILSRKLDKSSTVEPLKRRYSSRTFRYGYLVTT